MSRIDDILGGGQPQPDDAIVPPDVQRKRDETANRIRASEGAPPIRPLTPQTMAAEVAPTAVGAVPQRPTIAQLLDAPAAGGGGATISSLLGPEAKPAGTTATPMGAVKQFVEALGQSAAAGARMMEHFGASPELGGAFPEIAPGIGGPTPPAMGGPPSMREEEAARVERQLRRSQEERMAGAGFLGQLGLGAAQFAGGHAGMFVPGAGTALALTQEALNDLNETYAKKRDQGASEERALRAGGIEAGIGTTGLAAFGPVTRGAGALINNTVGSLESRFGGETLKRVVANGLAASGIFATQGAAEEFADHLQFGNPNEPWDQVMGRITQDALKAAAQGAVLGVTGLLPGHIERPTKASAELNEVNRNAQQAVQDEPPKEPKPRLKGPVGTKKDVPAPPVAEAQGIGAKEYPLSSESAVTLDSLPAVEEGKIRIYRAHGGEDASDTASGRWGTRNEEDLQGYLEAKRSAGKPADIRYIDATPEEERAWRGNSQKDEVKQWTNAPDRDYYLPADAEWKSAKRPAGLDENQAALSNRAGGFAAGFGEYPWVDNAAGGAAKPGEVKISLHDADNPFLEKFGGVLQRVMDKYGMKFGVVLGTRKMADSINAEMTSGNLFPKGPLGQWLSTGPKTGVIYLDDDVIQHRPESAAFTALHEFGHALMKHMFDKAPYAIQQALRTEYMAMMRSAAEGKETWASFYDKFFGPGASEAHKWGGEERVTEADLAKRPQNYAFSEWLANRFAEHEGRERLSDDPVSRYFTRSLGLMERTHREVSEALGYKGEFHDWIQGLAERGEFDPLTQRRVETLNDRFDHIVRQTLGFKGQERGFFRDAKLEDLERINEWMMLRRGTAEGRDFALASAWDARGGIDWKHFTRVMEATDTGAFDHVEGQAAPEKAHQAVMYERVEDNVEKMLVRTPEGREVAKDRKARVSADITYYSKFLGMSGGLLDIANKNLHIPGVRWFRDRIQQYHIDKMTIKSTAMDNLKEWDNLGAAKGDILGRVLFEEDLGGRRLTPAELQQRGFTPEIKAVYDKVQNHFDHILARMETSAVRNAILALQGQPGQMAAALSEIRQQFRVMKDKPYFPHSRFGEHGLAVKATKDFTHQGRQYKAGETISVTHHETRADRDNWEGQMRKEMGAQNLSARPYVVKDRAVAGMQGLPQEFANHLSNLLNLSAVQQGALRDLQYKMAPHQSFMKHMIRRKGTAGFSTDAQRVYASYMQRAANGISRMEHLQGLRDDIAEMRRSGADLSSRGVDPAKRQQLADWFEKTLDYMQNPGHEASALRAAGFLWFLGLNVKSAVVNLTQPLMTTYPYLAARHGDLGAVAAMSKALVKSIGTFDLAQDLAAKMKLRLPVGKLLTADEKSMLEQGKKEGWYDETQGALLAGVADPSIFTRYVNKSIPNSIWRWATTFASAPFRYTELFNRKATAIAAYNLARDKGLPHNDAVAATRDAVQKTQFEYAQWNRPEWMRGRKGALFLFGQYEANMLRFAFGGDPGWWRSQLMLLTLGGIAGVPLAGMAMDLVDLTKKYLSPNQASDTRKDIEDFFQGLDLNNDLIMNGLSRYTMGLGLMDGMPQLDISSSIQMGYTRFLGGKDLIKDLKTGDANRIIQDQVSNWGGPLANLGVNVVKAAVSKEMDQYRRWSQLLPSTTKALADAWRREDPTSSLAQSLNPMLPWWAQAVGGKRDKSGAVTLPYNYEDWSSRAEHMAKYFNFEGTKQTQQMEAEQGARQAMDFYKARRSQLTHGYATMYRERDREGVADAKAAIERYNREVPHIALKISPQDLSGEVKRELEAKQKTEHGIPSGVGRRYYDVYRGYEQGKHKRAVTTPDDTQAPKGLGP